MSSLGGWFLRNYKNIRIPEERVKFGWRQSEIDLHSETLNFISVILYTEMDFPAANGMHSGCCVTFVLEYQSLQGNVVLYFSDRLTSVT